MARNAADETVINIGKQTAAASFTGGLEFTDLTYTVTTKKKLEGKWVSKDVDLLNKITGYAPKGCITAVMGPSGAGKSTLLDGLAGRIASGSLKGKVSLDGRLMSPGLIKRTSAYVMQDDRLFPMLTVYETLLFAADFRLGAIPIYEKKDRVEKLIEQLGLSGENSIEFLIDIIQEYDQSDIGVQPLAEFARIGVKPPPLSSDDDSISTVAPTPLPPRSSKGKGDQGSSHGKRLLHLGGDDFDRSIRSPSWSGTPTGIINSSVKIFCSSSPGYIYSSDILPSTPTPHSSDYTVNENDYLTPNAAISSRRDPTGHGSAKFANSFFHETWILIRRNFKNIRRTPELFLSRLMVLTVMGFMMATMFMNPKSDLQGITNRLSFMIFTVCLFFFSSNDAVPAFIQERFIFVRETSHNAYRASSYTIAGVITYLPFLLLQSGVYAAIVWKALKLRGPFHYFLLVLYVSLLSTNSFVVFVSSVVPNYILGYASVIAFTALFFLFCGYFLNSADIPPYWKWMNKISTITYPYEGLLMNQYQTDEVFGTTKEGPITGFGILNSLNISGEESEKWKKIAVMLGWAAFYRVLFYIVLRFFSKNQRS
ncbi:ABC transporter G family member STR2 [Linum perenne]